MLKKVVAAGLAGAFFVATAASAADYPDQAVSIIVPSKAGGSTDTTARIFAEIAEGKYPGFEFVINNMGGSGVANYCSILEPVK